MLKKDKMKRKPVVLSVDSDYISQVYLRKVLKRYQYVPLLAIDTKEGTDLLEANKTVDICVLDLKYPMKDWVAFLKKLRAKSASGEFKLFITGCKSSEKFYEKIAEVKMDPACVAGIYEVPEQYEIMFEKIHEVLGTNTAATA